MLRFGTALAFMATSTVACTQGGRGCDGPPLKEDLWDLVVNWSDSGRSPYLIHKHNNWKSNMMHFMQAAWNCNFNGFDGSQTENGEGAWYLDDVIECMSNY